MLSAQQCYGYLPIAVIKFQEPPLPVRYLAPGPVIIECSNGVIFALDAMSSLPPWIGMPSDLPVVEYFSIFSYLILVARGHVEYLYIGPKWENLIF